EPESDRGGESGQGHGLARNEKKKAEQGCLRAEPRDSLLGDQLLRRAASARPDVTNSVNPCLRRQLALQICLVSARASGGKHVGLDPERREMCSELQRPLDTAPAARRKVARHEQDFQRRSVTGATVLIFFSSRRRHTRLVSDWSSDVCSSD